MKRTLLMAALIGTMGLSSTAFAKATVYTAEKSHSNIGFSSKYLKIGTVTGEFNNYKLKIKWDNKDPKNSSLSGVVKVASIDTGNAKRDNHLRGGDFFNAKRYPDIKLESTKIRKKSKRNFEFHGKLTIRDRSKDIVFPIRVSKEIDLGDKVKRQFKGEFTINRFDYDLNWKKRAQDVLVAGELVRVKIYVMGNARKSEEKAAKKPAS